MATRVEVGPEDGDKLPWLEAVEDEDDRGGPSAAKLIAALVVGLLAIGAIVGGLFWLGNRDGGVTHAAGQPELIAAPEGPYKVKPTEPGGMAVEGRGDTRFATSEGEDPNARINVDAIPEAPVAGARGTRAGAEAAGTQRQPVEDTRVAAQEQPAATPPAPAPAAAGGATVQLGAFSSNASAEAAWKSLSGRFAVLKPLSHSVEGATVGGKSVFRLRAGVANRAAARELCGRLTVAGESCVIL